MERADLFIGKKTIAIIIAVIVTLMLLTILQDSLYAYFHATSFYLSESLLFTSFWWIFVPFLYIQYRLAKNIRFRSIAFILLIIAPILLHFATFPSLVWIVSRLFFENTFRFSQTLKYSLSAYLYIAVAIYTIPLIIALYLKNRGLKAESTGGSLPDSSSFISNIIINERNKKTSVNVADIQYFGANSPYIDIYTSSKKYLYNETLKSIAGQLDYDQFIRVHKSTIVNINYVVSITSRLNGDYDLTLKDGTVLRVSRNYVANFKNKFKGLNRVAVI